MTVRFYLLPLIGDGVSVKSALRPKYAADWAIDHPGVGLRSEWKEFAREGTYLVAADVTVAQNTEISGNADVITIPANLDSQIGAALATVQSKLDALNIPSDWVQSTNTYRDVLRVVIKVFRLINRFNAQQKVNFFASGVTLNTQINQLNAAQRNALTQAAQSFGLDAGGITPTMQIRQALRIVAVQLPSTTMMGEVF